MAEIFLATDRPLPSKGIEDDSDSAWNEFQKLRDGLIPESDTSSSTQSAAEDASEADTQFLPTAAFEDKDYEHLRCKKSLLEELAALVNNHNRACPMPTAWLHIYELLPKTTLGSQVFPPYPPVQGVAWKLTSTVTKKMCFFSHLEWADKNGVLDVVGRYVQQLPESGWRHMDTAQP